MSSDTIYTGYAITTEQHGYVVVTRDYFSNGECFWPCSDQKSPFMAFEDFTANKMVDWLNEHFAGIGAVVKPLRYSNGVWIDQP